MAQIMYARGTVMGDRRQSMELKANKYGFTMVELSLSIAFLSILSITIVLIITNAVSAYHRGLTLNAVNSTGMDLIDDFRSTIQNSSYISVNSLCDGAYNDQLDKVRCKDNDAANLITRVRSGEVKVNGNSIGGNVPLYGAFCTGRYSYIWNSGYFFASDLATEVVDVAKASLLIEGDDGRRITDFKLLKAKDRKREICIGSTDYASPDIDPEFKITNSMEIQDDPPVDLLEAGMNLAIYDLTAPAPADNGVNDLFYSMSFILGTVQGGINIMVNGEYCATPGGYNAAVENFDYCAINKFNFAVQATGENK